MMDLTFLLSIALVLLTMPLPMALLTNACFFVIWLLKYLQPFALEYYKDWLKRR